MKIAIVTGASRGLGYEAAKNFIEKGYDCITLSRSHPHLEDAAKEFNVNYHHLSVDLSQLDALNKLLDTLINHLQEQAIDELIVLNNAGAVNPIGPVGTLDNDEIIKQVNINVTSLMLINNTIKKRISANRKIFINITSGAAEKGIFGWNVYSSTKAAVNKYTETAALEADIQQLNDIHIAFSPGIMDTEMQADIRAVDESQFKDIETFRNYKKEGQLRSPKEVADLLLGVITDKKNLINGKLYRVYDLV